MARLLGVGPVPQAASGAGNFWGTSSGLGVTGRGGIGLRAGEQRASDEGAALQALFDEHKPQQPEPVLVADASDGMPFLKQALDNARQGWNREYRSVLQGPSPLYDFTKSSRELLGTISGYDATNRGIAALKEGDYLRGGLNVIQGFAEAGTTVFGFGAGNAGAGLRVGTSMSASELAAVKATYVGSAGNAAETAAAAARMDLSAQFTVSKTPQGVRLQYGDPNGWSEVGGDSHGIIGFVDKDGVLGVDVYASVELRAKYGSGSDMYSSMMTRLQQENVNITGIRGAWLKGTDSVNYAQYQSGLAAGLTPAQSALNTWTGKLAQSYGYSQVESITGSSSNVYVLFRKSGSGR